ncbi:MAG: hypothetical protein RMY34_26355 [Aulosira sp. DedQUE10]|nr:hypothetical protein [Aulosira sp. DedQUE10]
MSLSSHHIPRMNLEQMHRWAFWLGLALATALFVNLKIHTQVLPLPLEDVLH